MTIQCSELEVAIRGNQLFGTSGVRGVVGKFLTTDLCRDIARAAGTALAAQSHICIATDTRLSREIIKDAAISGFLAAGIDVTDLGILPTPVLAFLTRQMGFDNGVMITASHNPPEYNGIKLFNRSGIGYSKAQEAKIESIYHQKRFRSGHKGYLTHNPSAREGYFHFIEDIFANNGLSRHLKIVIDAGNGAAAGFASELFSALGLNIIPLNNRPDGRFPGRDPEPRGETLGGTVDFLKQQNADLAVCFDGDADRVVFCDREGFLGFNEMIAFVSRIAVKGSGNRKLVATVDTGRLVDMSVADLGGEVVRGAVGDVSIAHLARELDAAIGVEPVGVYIIPRVGYFPDSMFAALTLISQLSDVSQIRDFFAGMPPLCFGKRKVACHGHLKAAVIQELARITDRLGASRWNTLDGLRLEFDDSWLLIRASGTEPVIRVVAESTSKKGMTTLLDRGTEAVVDALEGLRHRIASPLENW